MPTAHNRPPPGRHADRGRHPDPGQPPRRRGGQPANTNALKHGLYSRTLTPEAVEALQVARTLPVTDLSEEIAALRARLAVLSPHQLANWFTGLSLLARLTAQQHRMSPAQAQQLADSIAAVVRDLGATLFPTDHDD